MLKPIWNKCVSENHGYQSEGTVRNCTIWPRDTKPLAIEICQVGVEFVDMIVRERRGADYASVFADQVKALGYNVAGKIAFRKV